MAYKSTRQYHYSNYSNRFSSIHHHPTKMWTMGWWKLAIHLLPRCFVLLILARTLCTFSFTSRIQQQFQSLNDYHHHRNAKALVPETQPTFSWSNDNHSRSQAQSPISRRELRQRNQNTAALCVVQKDEVQYLNEWVDYHLALGFSDIYIYDNANDHAPLVQWDETRRKRQVRRRNRQRQQMQGKNNSTVNNNTATPTVDPPTASTNTIISQDKVHLIHYPGPKAQVPVYKDCAARVHHNRHTWVTFLDVDEFLVLKQHQHVVDFARQHAPPGRHVALNWQIFGTAGRKQHERFPVTQRFPCIHRTVKQDYIKSLMRVNDLWPVMVDIRSPHAFPLREGAQRVDTNGVPLRFSNQNKHGPRDVAVIHHYIYRSHAEHVNKRTRGDVYFGNRTDRADWGDQARRGIDPWTGKPLPKGRIWDDLAWQRLKNMVPKYGFKYENNAKRSMREGVSCTTSQVEQLQQQEQQETSQKDDKNATIVEPMIDPKETVAICAVAKNESFYMNEWADYHLALGFSDLYIYDLSPSSHTMLNWRNRRGDDRIHVIPFPSMMEAHAYRDCARAMPHLNHTWVLFAGINQFLVLYQQDSVLDFAKQYVGEGQTGLNWNVYGTSGRTVYEPWPVTQRFPCRMSYFFKDSLRMNAITKVTALGKSKLMTNTTVIPRKEGTPLLDTSRKTISSTERHNGPRNVAVIHHYLTKSEEEHRQNVGKGAKSGIFITSPKDEPQELERIPAGSVYDDRAWQALKRKDPSYARYEGRRPAEEAKCEYSPEGY